MLCFGIHIQTLIFLLQWLFCYESDLQKKQKRLKHGRSRLNVTNYKYNSPKIFRYFICKLYLFMKAMPFVWKIIKHVEIWHWDWYFFSNVIRISGKHPNVDFLLQWCIFVGKLIYRQKVAPEAILLNVIKY